MHNTAYWSKVLTTLSPHVLPSRLQRLQTQLSFRVADTVLVLENLDKEMNIHACLRTAESLGLQDVHLINNHPSSSQSELLINTNSVHKGASKWLTITHHRDTLQCVSKLRQDKFLIAASDVGSISLDIEAAAQKTLVCHDSSLNICRPRVAIVMGNELKGCSQSILAAADVRFFIPQCGFSQSLNVSVATGLSLNVFLNRTKDYSELALHAHKTRVSSEDLNTVFTRSKSLSPPFVEPLSDALRNEVLARVLLRSLPAASAILKRAGISEPD
jgi:tRNA (guanosine-2'-O-)-methyltransferase